MADKDIRNIVFSSSAGVYGTPKDEVVTEQTAPDPQSPYGETKLIGEWLLGDQANARSTLNHTSLRYFNVVGSATRRCTTPARTTCSRSCATC